MVAHPDSVTRSVDLPASADEVWHVLTTGDLLGHCLGGIATIDARPGGEIAFVDGEAVRLGAIDQLHEPTRLSFIWYADERDPSEVIIDLDERETGTRLTVTERKFTWEFHDTTIVQSGGSGYRAPVGLCA